MLHFDDEQLPRPQVYCSADTNKKQEGAAGDRFCSGEEYQMHPGNCGPEAYYQTTPECHGGAGQGKLAGTSLCRTAVECQSGWCWSLHGLCPLRFPRSVTSCIVSGRPADSESINCKREEDFAREAPGMPYPPISQRVLDTARSNSQLPFSNKSCYFAAERADRSSYQGRDMDPQQQEMAPGYNMSLPSTGRTQFQSDFVCAAGFPGQDGPFPAGYHQSQHLDPVQRSTDSMMYQDPQAYGGNVVFI